MHRIMMASSIGACNVFNRNFVVFWRALNLSQSAELLPVSLSLKAKRAWGEASRFYARDLQRAPTCGPHKQQPGSTDCIPLQIWTGWARGPAVDL